MIFEGRQQKGLSLIEIAMVIILSVVFISGGSYIISLFKVFAQSCVVATDMNSVRNIIISSDVEYKTGKYDVSSITNDNRFNKYQVYFGNDGYTLISGSSPVSVDVFLLPAIWQNITVYGFSIPTIKYTRNICLLFSR